MNIRKLLLPINYITWLFKYLKLMLGFDVLKDIKIISIEFCAVCNLHCKYCFLEKKDRPMFLEINIYEKLIKEICINKKFDIKVMEWPVSGEFLLYPDYKKVIEITKKYMEKFPNFKPHIILNTNMVLMDKEKIDLVLNSGIVKQIICSIDGHNKDSFEIMRPPAKFEIVLENMKRLVKKNKNIDNAVFIQINNGRNSDSFGKRLGEEMKEIFSLVRDVRFWQPQNWNESFNITRQKIRPAKGFCSFVFNNVTVSTSGFVSRCCMDLKGSTEYEDFTKKSLEEILCSKTRKNFLTKMFRNKRYLLDGCRTCSITNENNDNVYKNSLLKTLICKLKNL